MTHAISLLASGCRFHLLPLRHLLGFRVFVPFAATALHERYLSSGFLGANAGEFESVALKLELNYAEYLPRDPAAEVLDAGCGMGHFLYYVEQKGYTNVMGVDVSPEAIAFCSERVAARLELVPSLFEFLRPLHEAFELIILKDVIEHLPQESVIPTLEAAHRALKPGGSLVIETGNMASFTGTYLLYNDFTHHWGFAEVSLRAVLLAAGFTRIVIRGARRRERLKERLARALWIRTLRWIYRVERGKSGIPTILDKLLIASATRDERGAPAKR